MFNDFTVYREIKYCDCDYGHYDCAQRNVYHFLLSMVFSVAVTPNKLVALIRCNVRRKVTYS